MKIVRIKGGLGNQMFQYAFARLIEYKTRDIVKIDMSAFDCSIDDPIRQPRLLRFNVKLPIANIEEINSIRLFKAETNSLKNIYKIKTAIEAIVNKNYYFEKNRAYRNVNELLEYTYFDGYWQSWRYLEAIKDIIKLEFTPKYFINDKTKKMQKKMSDENSVFLGVRRGDYLTDVKHYGSFGSNYYNKGMEYICLYVDNPVFYIFTNDIFWVKKNLNFGTAKVYYRSDEDVIDAFEELILMSSCKHSIIGNSTFHWWGSWLNSNPNKIVIAPSKWFFDDKPIDIVPPEWIKMSERGIYG